MNRTLLAALAALSLNASADEWRYWTWPGQARMAAVTGRTAWFATGGGVFEWDLDANTSRLYQKNDGLTSTDLVSIAAQTDGSVWAVSSTGQLSVKRPGVSYWESKGTYTAPPSPWTFTPRAAVMHHNTRSGRDVLVLGGPQGLTFFAADSGLSLDWTDQFGTLSRREVRSLLMSGDTLWVGLKGGLARILPPWDSLGNNRAFVSDSRRWTVLASSAETDAYDALFPTEAGVSWQPGFDFAAKDILLKTGQAAAADNPPTLWWKGKAFYSTGKSGLTGSSALFPSHALEVGTDLLVSSDAKEVQYAEFSHGPLLLKADGTFQYPPMPTNSFPNSVPPLAFLESGGRITSWSNNNVYTKTASQSQWETPWTGAFSTTIVPYLTNFTVQDHDQTTLVRGPAGSLWVGSWGQGLWGALPSAASDSLAWTTWNTSNSCLEGTSPKDPNFPTIATLTSTDSAVWGVLYRQDNAVDSLQVFRTGSRLDDSLRCWKISAPSNTNTSGLRIQGSRMWVASTRFLTVHRRPDQSGSPTIVFRSSGDFRRILPIERSGVRLMLALLPNEIRAYPLDAVKDSALASSLRQASPLTARQKWSTFAVDGLGQIWLAGSEGIDILALEPGDSSWTFRHVRELTEADGLPADQILSLSIDASTGSALVATSAGLGLWASPYRPLPARLETKIARVWPNPLRTRSHRELVVDGATATSEFFLHAADGALVLHLEPSQQSGGYFRWTIPSPDKLRPGVYRWTLRDGNRKVGGPLLIAE